MKRKGVIRLELLCEVFMPCSYLLDQVQAVAMAFDGSGRWVRRITRNNTQPDPNNPSTELCWHLQVAQEVWP